MTVSRSLFRFALSAGAAAWVVSAAPALAQSAAPSLSNDRWSENWDGSALWYKDIDLGDEVSLDFGLDARWKAESIEAPRFGLTAQGDDSWLQQRLMGHANLRFGDEARVFFQLGAHDVMGKSATGGNDENRLDVHQAFLDLTPTLFGGETLVRVGRQEFIFASRQRFFDPGDSPNIRQHYDAVLASYERGDWRVAAMFGQPVENIEGAFDDERNEGQNFWGVEAERSFGDDMKTRVYLVDLARENFSIGGASANDRRRTLGATVIGSHGPYDYDVELVRQFGDFGAQEVSAWGGAAQISRGLDDVTWEPRIGVRLTYGSGDSDPLDGEQETYAPPQPRGSWFSEGGFNSHANVIEAAATAELSPRDDLTLTFRYSGLWRPETADFAYASPFVALPGTRGGDAFIATSPNINANWRVNRHVTVRAHGAYFDVSDHISDAGGENGAYANVSLALRY